MSLKDNWTDLIDGESEVVVKPINDMAHAIIEVEERTEEIGKNTNGYKQVVANALKGSASGEVVALKDVSPLEHGLGVRVSSKNLLDFKNITQAYSPPVGVTYEKTDNSIKIDNDGSSYSGSVTFNMPMTADMIGRDLTLSYKYESTGIRSIQVAIFYLKNNVQVVAGNAPNGVGTFKAPDDADKIQIRFVCYLQTEGVAGSITYSDVQLEKGTTATAYTPFVPDIGAVKLRAQGTNVLDTTNAPMFGTYSPSINRGYEYEKTSTGFRCLCDTGASIGSAGFGYQAVSIEPLRGKTLTVSFKRYSTLDDTKTGACCTIQAGDNELDNGYTYIGDALSNRVTYGEALLKDAINGYFKCTFTVPKDETRKNLFVALYLGVNAVAVQDSVVEYSDIQLEIDGATEYEPYIEPVEYAVNADGTVEGVKSIYPSTTLTTDTVGALIEVDYNRDINKAFAELQQAIISLGGNV